ncbi:extracellular solute-binding protein [Polaromonas sp. P1(28)-13]|nr:extracellular solute-binding protein [Polaromonas sp. P1(28)-13]
MKHSKVMALSLLTMALFTAAASAQTKGAAKEFRMLESGGPSGDSIEQAYIKPYTDKSGVKVVRESPSGIGKLQAMVQSKNVTSTLVELGSTQVALARAWPAGAAGLERDQRGADVPGSEAAGRLRLPVLLHRHGLGKGGKKPATWADFWNVKDFPGKRALPDYASYALPLALLADGVKPENLYPLDVDRAFASLQKIKAHVAVWWTSGAQAPQLLEDREVKYAAAWSGRIVGNPKLDYTYNQGLLQVSYFVVPKGADAAGKAASMGLLHEMSQLKNQATASKIIPYTGASPGIEKTVAQDKVNDYPTSEANKKLQVLSDPTWTAENVKLIEKRWQEFKLGL